MQYTSCIESTISLDQTYQRITNAVKNYEQENNSTWTEVRQHKIKEDIKARYALAKTLLQTTYKEKDTQETKLKDLKQKSQKILYLTHPDRNKGNEKKAQELFQIVLIAKELAKQCIKNPAILTKDNNRTSFHSHWEDSFKSWTIYHRRDERKVQEWRDYDKLKKQWRTKNWKASNNYTVLFAIYKHEMQDLLYQEINDNVFFPSCIPREVTLNQQEAIFFFLHTIDLVYNDKNLLMRYTKKQDLAMIDHISRLFDYAKNLHKNKKNTSPFTLFTYKDSQGLSFKDYFDKIPNNVFTEANNKHWHKKNNLNYYDAILDPYKEYIVDVHKHRCERIIQEYTNNTKRTTDQDKPLLFALYDEGIFYTLYRFPGKEEYIRKHINSVWRGETLLLHLAKNPSVQAIKAMKGIFDSLRGLHSDPPYVVTLHAKDHEQQQTFKEHFDKIEEDIFLQAKKASYDHYTHDEKLYLQISGLINYRQRIENLYTDYLFRTYKKGMYRHIKEQYDKPKQLDNTPKSKQLALPKPFLFEILDKECWNNFFDNKEEYTPYLNKEINTLYKGDSFLIYCAKKKAVAPINDIVLFFKENKNNTTAPNLLVTDAEGKNFKHYFEEMEYNELRFKEKDNNDKIKPHYRRWIYTYKINNWHDKLLKEQERQRKIDNYTALKQYHAQDLLKDITRKPFLFEIYDQDYWEMFCEEVFNNNNPTITSLIDKSINALYQGDNFFTYCAKKKQFRPIERLFCMFERKKFNTAPNVLFKDHQHQKTFKDYMEEIRKKENKIPQYLYEPLQSYYTQHLPHTSHSQSPEQHPTQEISEDIHDIPHKQPQQRIDTNTDQSNLQEHHPSTETTQPPLSENNTHSNDSNLTSLLVPILGIACLGIIAYIVHQNAKHSQQKRKEVEDI